jgi:hypothetical protein
VPALVALVDRISAQHLDAGLLVRPAEQQQEQQQQQQQQEQQQQQQQQEQQQQQQQQPAARAAAAAVAAPGIARLPVAWAAEEPGPATATAPAESRGGGSVGRAGSLSKAGTSRQLSKVPASSLSAGKVGSTGSSKSQPAGKIPAKRGVVPLPKPAAVAGPPAAAPPNSARPQQPQVQREQQPAHAAPPASPVDPAPLSPLSLVQLQLLCSALACLCQDTAASGEMRSCGGVWALAQVLLLHSAQPQLTQQHLVSLKAHALRALRQAQPGTGCELSGLAALPAWHLLR